MQKFTRKMYDEFLAGFNGEDEYKPKREKSLIVDTQDDKDFLDGWYSHDPEDQRPTITVRQEKQTQPTTFKQEKTPLSQANTTAYKEPKSYSSSLNSMTDNKYSNYLQNAAKGVMRRYKDTCRYTTLQHMLRQRWQVQ